MLAAESAVVLEELLHLLQEPVQRLLEYNLREQSVTKNKVLYKEMALIFHSQPGGSPKRGTTFVGGTASNFLP